MDNVGYVALSHAALIQRATDVTANNVANANSGGFKASNVVFDKLLVDTKSPGPTEVLAYSIDKGSWNNLDAGVLTETGNALDLALQGDGWFAIQTAGGLTGITKAGSFYLTPNGEVTTSDGNVVLDAGGAPLILPPDIENIAVSSDGTVTNIEGEVVGQFGVFAAPNAASYQQLGASTLIVPAAEAQLEASNGAKVIQGFIEGSNVNPIEEMAKLITLQRSYERVMSLADNADKLRSQTLQRLSNSNG